jgi:hypothetical protein
MLKDVVVHDGLLRIGTGTFVCMSATRKDPSDLLPISHCHDNCLTPVTAISENLAPANSMV